VSDKLDTASVSGQVTSDKARALSTEVQWDFIAAHLSVVLNVAEDGTGLSAHNAVGFIEAKNAVHTLGIEDDFVVDGHGATD